MVWVAGADACKKGWFRASRESETGELRFDLLEQADHLLEVDPQPAVLALDTPVGLSDVGQRDCDRNARKFLGRRRRTSVFPAPIRTALKAKTREEASMMTQARDGRRVGAQAWGIYVKVRQVDKMLQSNSETRQRIREVHPEICFWAWAGYHPMKDSKKTKAGKEERCKLAEEWLGLGVLRSARGHHLKKLVEDDDILDSIAAVWTATRIVNGTAKTLPKRPPLNSTGLRMEIVY